MLSTKKLKTSQRELLLNSGVSFVEYNAITIQPLDLEIPETLENVIFTSQNAVASFLSNSSDIEAKSLKCFCVGDRTTGLLENNGFSVLETAIDSKTLGETIVGEYYNFDFHYFCGESRRDELPDILEKNKIVLTEIPVYRTTPNLKKFDRQFDVVLFFSPSGVRSFLEKNKAADTLACCIGPTTADEAKHCFENITIANSPTVESTIARAMKELKKSIQH